MSHHTLKTSNPSGGKETLWHIWPNQLESSYYIPKKGTKLHPCEKKSTNFNRNDPIYRNAKDTVSWPSSANCFLSMDFNLLNAKSTEKKTNIILFSFEYRTVIISSHRLQANLQLISTPRLSNESADKT